MNLPSEMPKGIKYLPRNQAGFPVPWFVAWIDGKPDFRVIGPNKIADALRERLCWLCGRKMNRRESTFVIGPMCAVNRTTAEPPSHRACAEYAAKACPFLTNPTKQRRETHVPEDTRKPAGEMISRNPGVSLLWESTTWRLFSDGSGGMLIDIGTPTSTFWFAHGREATRDEVMASIDSGLPILKELAQSEGDEALRRLEALYERAIKLVPIAA